MDIDELELNFEIKALQDEIKKLREENKVLKEVIKENDLEDEIQSIAVMSPEEQICIDGIDHLLNLFKTGTFTKDDVNNFDVLHKNLRLIKGKSVDSKKPKKTNVADLLKIVNDSKGK